jgi:hypothetical protein
MKHHEREFFINTIRSGNVYLKFGNLKLCVKPMKYFQCIEALEVYNDAYDDSLADGLMTEEESDAMMRSTGIWTEEEDAKVEGIKQDMEKLKIEIYNNRTKSQMRERIRQYLRIAEKALYETVNLKNSYFANTCEGTAALDKTTWIIANTTYLDDKLYNFEDIQVEHIVMKWRESFLEEGIIRELARNEPWVSHWRMKDHINLKLFYNDENSEITENQKNLVMWSQLYDNIAESMDAPAQEVLEDDDVLDGWFIIQAKKRKKEKLEKEFNDKTGDKIKNAHEVYVMSGSVEENELIENMNDLNSRRIKKERAQTLQAKGQTKQHEFKDEILDKRAEINSQYRDKFRR